MHHSHQSSLAPPIGLMSTPEHRQFFARVKENYGVNFGGNASDRNRNLRSDDAGLNGTSGSDEEEDEEDYDGLP